MIEDFTRTAVTTLLAQGTGWVVAVLLGIWAYILDKRLAKLQFDCDVQSSNSAEAVKEQYEKRLSEFREIIDVMTNSTHTVKAMHGSLTATTEAINQLTVGFAKLLNEFQGHGTKWDDRGGHMAKQLADIQRRLEELQREVHAA